MSLGEPARASAPIEFQTEPSRYRHWKIERDGEVAYLIMDVQPDGGLAADYELKLNSYDLAVDIELNAASHGLKVNFCKFTNETRLAIEDACENSKQIYLCAVNGTAAGGGYELALAT